MESSRRKILAFYSLVVFLTLVGISLIYEDRDALPQVLNNVLSAVVIPSPSPVLGTQTTVVAEEGVVSRVIDGDTIELSDGRVIRYIGMDTPETHHPTKGVQCFGAQATQRNKELVLGKKVSLEKDVSETDRYDRLLRYVYVDGALVNQQLVAEGYAFARSYPPDIAKQELFRQAESTAREAAKGLWSSCPLGE